MSTRKVIYASTMLVWLLFAAGCLPSDPKRETKEQSRLELEEKSRREAEAANKAITHMNQKLGQKVAPLDLGLPSQTKTAPTTPADGKP